MNKSCSCNRSWHMCIVPVCIWRPEDRTRTTFMQHCLLFVRFLDGTTHFIIQFHIFIPIGDIYLPWKVCRCVNLTVSTFFILIDSLPNIYFVTTISDTTGPNDCAACFAYGITIIIRLHEHCVWLWHFRCNRFNCLQCME